ncbi:MAG TPA: cytochrome C oxidase subunit IV family protein [Flavobacteriaceae bacterium]|nr:cytochrome C oxidase subunit IV family protein [Flavobacteriaceae bacterium]
MAETITKENYSEKRKKQIQRIWYVFWILAIITAIEVLLGIFRPGALETHSLCNMHILNWIFVGLTVVKAYYIVWAFMHMEDEVVDFRRAITWTIAFYISYMMFVFLVEGDYLYEVIHNDIMIWDF